MKFIRQIISLKPEILFIIIALPFGLISSILVPQLSVNDEGAHLYRTYSLSRGHLPNYNCSYPNEIINKVRESGKGEYNFIVNNKNSDILIPHSCGSAGSYYPTMHLPQAIGLSIGKYLYNSPAVLILMGRITNLLFFIGAMYFIVKYVAVGKWIFFVLGLLPTSIHTAASLSYDAFNMIAILAFIAVILNFYLRKEPLTKKHLIILSVVSFFMTTAKTTNILLLPLIFLIPSKHFKQLTKRRSKLLNKYLVVSFIFITSFVLVYIWQKVGGDSISLESTNRVTGNPFYFIVVLYNTYINPFLGYSDVVTRGVVGEFSSFKYHLPTFLVLVSYGLISFSLIADDYNLKNNKISSRLALAFTLALVVSIIAITYGLYSMWATLPIRLGPNAIYADGVQGRYFTPLLALLIPLGIWLRKYIKITTSSYIIYRTVILVTTISLLIFYTAQSYMFIS